MPWIAAWKAIRPASSNPYLFPGQHCDEPLTADMIVRRWHDLRLMLGIQGLWTYDLRRTLACYLSNELHYDDLTIRAILNHSDGSALSHYCFKSFDSLTKPIQDYADWLCALRQESASDSQAPMLVPVRPAIPIPTPGPQPELAPPLVGEADTTRLQSLSVREREVLAWFAYGQTCTYIGACLGISPKTVYAHRARLMEKLHLTKMTDLIRYAIAQKADTTTPIPEQPTPPPVIAPAVVSPMMPAAMAIAYKSHSIEREEWPG